MRIRHESRGDEVEINVISLIDVLLTLLMFFVLTTTFVRHTRMQVTLPKASPTAQDEQHPMLILVIDHDGHYYLNNEAVQGEGEAPLQEAILRVAGHDHERPVTLRADALTTHQSVITAMDALAQLGFSKLSIATTPNENHTP
jgi:biopolymer transport protein ExbD